MGDSEDSLTPPQIQEIVQRGPEKPIYQGSCLDHRILSPLSTSDNLTCSWAWRPVLGPSGPSLGVSAEPRREKTGHVEQSDISKARRRGEGEAARPSLWLALAGRERLAVTRQTATQRTSLRSLLVTPAVLSSEFQ